jgi:hypothetical protein
VNDVVGGKDGDLVLHFENDWSAKGGRAFLSSRYNGVWRNNTDIVVAFAPGQPFELRFLLKALTVAVTADGHGATEFKYRAPLNRARTNALRIFNDVVITSVVISNPVVEVPIIALSRGTVLQGVSLVRALHTRFTTHEAMTEFMPCRGFQAICI